MPEKQKLILDCDTKNEIDDQFAIVYALASPEVELEGVVSVQNDEESGKNSVEIFHKEAKKILDLCDSDVPAYKGSSHPLISEDEPERSEGVDFIIDTVMNSDEEIYVAGTGPSTDLVNACLLEPEIKDKCTFIWLGGFRNEGLAKKFGHSECNLDGDELAARLLFEMNIDLVFLPAKGVCVGLTTHCSSLAEYLEDLNKPITNYLGQLLKSRDRPFWILWDLAAVATAKDYGIENKLKISAPEVVDGKFKFPKNTDERKITMIDRIDAPSILSQAKKYFRENI